MLLGVVSSFMVTLIHSDWLYEYSKLSVGAEALFLVMLTVLIAPLMFSIKKYICNNSSFVINKNKIIFLLDYY